MSGCWARLRAERTVTLWQERYSDQSVMISQK